MNRSRTHWWRLPLPLLVVIWSAGSTGCAVTVKKSELPHDPPATTVAAPAGDAEVRERSYERRHRAADRAATPATRRPRRCRRGEFLDRNRCVDRCPRGTIDWQPSRTAQPVCNSARELRKIIADFTKALPGEPRDHAEQLLEARRQARLALRELERPPRRDDDRRGGDDDRDRRRGGDDRRSE